MKRLTKKKILENMVIRWAKVNKVNERYAFGRLYGAIYNVLHVDVYERAKNRHCIPMRIIECDGLLDEVIAIAQQIFKL